MIRLGPDRDGNRDKQAFKIQEAGYVYFNSHLKAKPTRRGGPDVRQKNKVVELLNPDPAMTLSANPGMDLGGPVSKIIGLARTKATLDRELAHLSLKDLVRLRLIKRITPTYASLEEFLKIRNSCHLVEEINGEFFCDCRDGIKGRVKFGKINIFC